MTSTEFQLHRRIPFWIAVAALFLTTGAVALSFSRRMSYDRQPIYLIGEAERGAKLFYGDKQCSICHTVNGRGGSLAPDLTRDRPETPTMGWLISKLWNHGPVMWRRMRPESKIRDLSAQDMADLLAFLGGPTYSEPPGSPLIGQKAFAERGCAACHGTAAEGTEWGPRVRADREAYTAATFAAKLWRHGPRMSDRVEQMGMQWPHLEPEDIGNLVSFVNAVPDSIGR